jgi:hypothetical protein
MWKSYKQTRPIFIYGAILAALVFALKWLQWEYLLKDGGALILKKKNRTGGEKNG